MCGFKSLLTLKNAIETGRLPEFVAQEEARGIGPADPRAINALVVKAAKAPQSKDRALHSPCGDGPTGT